MVLLRNIQDEPRNTKDSLIWEGRMSKTFGLIGVPTSMGAFAPGQEKGPRSLRDARLVERLTRADVEVVDYGDGEKVRRWRPDKSNRRAQNLGAVAEVIQETARRVEKADAVGHLPLVIGGDCTIELGTVAGLLSSGKHSGERMGLIYFDVHPDLNVPDSVGEGALDWMGVSHMLGEDGATETLSGIGPRFPLLNDEEVFLFSYGTEQATDWEREVIERRNLKGTPIKKVASDPGGGCGVRLEGDGVPLRPATRAFRCRHRGFHRPPALGEHGTQRGATLQNSYAGAERTAEKRASGSSDGYGVQPRSWRRRRVHSGGVSKRACPRPDRPSRQKLKRTCRGLCFCQPWPYLYSSVRCAIAGQVSTVSPMSARLSYVATILDLFRPHSPSEKSFVVLSWRPRLPRRLLRRTG